MIKAITRERGFSLIEVVIGLIFLAIGLLALASLHITSTRGNSFNSHMMQATYALQDGLESLKSLPMDSPQLQEGDYTVETPPVLGIAFNRGYTVVRDKDKDFKTIDYRVTWNDGTNHSISFSTIRSE